MFKDVTHHRNSAQSDGFFEFRGYDFTRQPHSFYRCFRKQYRLCCCIWHDWKKPERKRKNGIQLGVDQDHAYAWSRSRKGGWAMAQSPILGTTITLQRLKKRGYQSLTDVYIELNPWLCEPPYTNPYARWCERRTPFLWGGAVYSIGSSNTSRNDVYISQFEFHHR